MEKGWKKEKMRPESEGSRDLEGSLWAKTWKPRKRAVVIVPRAFSCRSVSSRAVED